MDIFLLYLFTRVDAIRGACAFIGFSASIAALSIVMFRSCEMGEDLADAMRGWPKRLLFVVLPAFISAMVLVPSRSDLAIIVGGKLAVDGLQSETAKKVYRIVQDMLDEELAKRRDGK